MNKKERNEAIKEWKALNWVEQDEPTEAEIEAMVQSLREAKAQTNKEICDESAISRRFVDLREEYKRLPFMEKARKEFMDWIDTSVICDELVFEALDQNGKKMTFRNAKKVWLEVLDVLGTRLEGWVNLQELELE